MQVLESVEAYCGFCREIVEHEVRTEHPDTGFCMECENGQALRRLHRV